MAWNDEKKAEKPRKKATSLLDFVNQMKNDKKLALDRDTFSSGDSTVDVVSSGSIIVDKLLGKGNSLGGIGKGRVTEIFGLESSGKTTLALHVAKKVQESGKLVLFVDMEAALDLDYARDAVGLDIQDIAQGGSLWCRVTPLNLEQCCDMVDRFVDDHEVSNIGLVIVDSVKAMIPKVVMEGQIGDEPPMALAARLTGRWLGKLVKKIHSTNTPVILLNQMSKNIKSSPFQSGGEFDTPGGLAIRFYASQRILLKQVTKETSLQINPISNVEEEMPDSVKTRATIVKNKLGTPYRSAEFYIKYGGGIDNRRSVLEMALSHNIIHQGGAWYSYKENEGGFKIQGEDNMKAYLLSPENAPLLKEIMNKILIKQDEEVKMASKHMEEEEKKVERKMTKKIKGSKSLVDEPEDVSEAIAEVKSEENLA